eukprot:jgi/Chrzof1/6399/Cz18g09070.t1
MFPLLPWLILQVRIAREFVPPGKLIWLERQKIHVKDLKKSESRSTDYSDSSSAVQLQPGDGSSRRGVTATASSRSVAAPVAAAAPTLLQLPRLSMTKNVIEHLTPHWCDSVTLLRGGMIVSKRMFVDHVPDGQLRNLKRVSTLKRVAAVMMMNA